MTDRDYKLLSGIAPTVAQTGDYPDYGLPWQEQARVTGAALGRDHEADAVVDDVEARSPACGRPPGVRRKRLAHGGGPG